MSRRWRSQVPASRWRWPSVVPWPFTMVRSSIEEIAMMFGVPLDRLDLPTSGRSSSSRPIPRGSFTSEQWAAAAAMQSQASRPTTATPTPAEAERPAAPSDTPMSVAISSSPPFVGTYSTSFEGAGYVSVPPDPADAWRSR